jgi:hypothetical protein
MAQMCVPSHSPVQLVEESNLTITRIQLLLDTGKHFLAAWNTWQSTDLYTWLSRQQQPTLRGNLIISGFLQEGGHIEKQIIKKVHKPFSAVGFLKQGFAFALILLAWSWRSFAFSTILSNVFSSRSAYPSASSYCCDFLVLRLANSFPIKVLFLGSPGF